MKRMFVFLLAVALTAMSIMPCFAAEAETTTPTPRYAYISANYVNFTINQSSQVSTSDVYCLLYNNYEVQIVCELQRYNNSRWYTIKTWTASGMREASLTKTLAVARGYTYRAYVTFYIYDNNGNLIETATNSDSAYIPSN